jgi:hypothetical protein
MSALIILSFITGFYPKLSQADTLPAVLYISQVQITGGTGKTQEDFIELFNPNPIDVNLKGYRLVKRTASGTVDTIVKSWTSDEFIPSYGFYLWANSGFTAIIPPADTVTTATISDDNGLGLRFGASDTGLLLDSVAWGQAQNSFSVVSPNPLANQSIRRTDLFASVGQYTVTSSAARNKLSQKVLPPVPPAEEESEEENQPDADPEPTNDPQVDPAPANDQMGDIPDADPDQNGDTQQEMPSPAVAVTGKIVISEIFANPSGDDSGSEAIELINNDTFPINLEGFQLTDAATPDSRAFIIGSVILLPNQVLLLRLTEEHFTLNNTSDTVTVFDRARHQTDTVSYTSAPEGKSYQRINGSFQWLAPTL